MGLPLDRVTVTATDAGRTRARRGPRTGIRRGVNPKQTAFDASEVPIAGCGPTAGVRFLNAERKVIAALALVCGEDPSRENAVVISFQNGNRLGIVVNGISLVKLASK